MTKSTSSAQLVEQLRAGLAELAPGERLPSTRVLVERHRVSPVTVSRALAELAAEGAVITRPGAGTFRAAPQPRHAPVDYGWQALPLGDGEIDTRGLSTASTRVDDGVVPLSSGYLHASLMPVRALSAAAVRASRRPDVWDPAPFGGIAGLRAWVARAVGGSVDARDVTLTTGGQPALSAVIRALVAADEPLLVESPTYPGVIALARAAGIRTVPVPTDADGPIPHLLAETFARTRAKAVALQPMYQNPTGAVLAPERREQVLAAAAEAGAFVVEDDYARWLSHPSGAPGAGPPAPLFHEDAEGRVIYICSLTKITSPSLRVGAVVARGPVVERIRALRLVDGLLAPRQVQETALELVSGAAWSRHLASIGEQLATRCAASVAGVAAHLPAVNLATRPRGGLHLWLRLPDHVDDVEVAARALRGGVAVLPGRPFFPAEPPAPYLRLTFSAAPRVADLEVGIRRLAAAVPELAGG